MYRSEVLDLVLKDEKIPKCLTDVISNYLLHDLSVIGEKKLLWNSDCTSGIIGGSAVLITFKSHAGFYHNRQCDASDNKRFEQKFFVSISNFIQFLKMSGGKSVEGIFLRNCSNGDVSKHFTRSFTHSVCKHRCSNDPNCPHRQERKLLEMKIYQFPDNSNVWESLPHELRNLMRILQVLETQCAQEDIYEKIVEPWPSFEEAENYIEDDRKPDYCLLINSKFKATLIQELEDIERIYLNL